MEAPRNSPPVAVRVVRPFASQDELLAAEANLFTRTGVILVGAPSRPQGVVLRFEICLRDGSAVMRGEGRVVGHRAPSSAEEGALILRFTRLDVKSKELLDRAVALREERRSIVPPGPPKFPSTKPVAPEPEPSPVPAEVEDADLLTEQAPPVALVEDAGPKEKAPVPSPSPASVPAPHPHPPAEPAPHPQPTHHESPPHRHAPEHMPAPTPSPVKRHRLAGSEEFRMSIEPEQRNSALEALRERAKRLANR